MNKLAFWAITRGGRETALKLASLWQQKYPHTLIGCFLPENLKPSLRQKITIEFNKWDAHIFIMASGIVVRCVGNLLKSKFDDPAVIVGDEKGQYLISLLSGHWGNANWLVRELSGLSHATPVITTSTDVQGIVAVEDLIRNWQAFPESLRPVKRLNSILANGGKLGIYWDNKTILKKPSCLPEKYMFSDSLKEADIIISNLTLPIDVAEKKLVLRIPYFSLGVGCRKNISFHQLWENFNTFINTYQLSISSFKSISSISLKKNEPALLELGKKLNLPLHFYDVEELNEFVSDENFSSFVNKTTGVGSVCEPAAMRGCQNPQLFVPKKCYPKTTFAIAADISILSVLDQVRKNK